VCNVVSFFCRSLIRGKMIERVEQQYCNKICEKFRHGVETLRKIQQACGYDVMESTQINQWYDQFKDVRTSGENKTDADCVLLTTVASSITNS